MQIFTTIRHKLEKYEKHISSVTLLTGFVFDNLTLRRIDQVYDMIVLFSYIIIAGICIIVLSVLERKYGENSHHSDWHFWLIMILQFAFGGLFSAFFIFYTRSGSFVASWPFFMLLAGLLLANEIFKNKYSILVFRVAIFFFVLLSFSALYLPVFLKEMSDEIFVLSGVLGLFIMWGFLHIVRYFLPKTMYQSRKQIIICTLGIFMTVNLLYFFNIIPPIPLALKNIALAHDVSKISNNYLVTTEYDKWYYFLLPEKYNAVQAESAYVMTSIFAPSNLKTTVIHKWQMRDGRGKWITRSEVAFDITGGRSDGYRGYSIKTNIEAGLWRVNVENSRGQLIGRLKFQVVKVMVAPALESKNFL